MLNRNAFWQLIGSLFGRLQDCSGYKLIFFVKKVKTKSAHFRNLLVAGIRLMRIPFIITNVYFFPTISFGIGWRSMMKPPYVFLGGSIPPHKTGFYMGCIYSLANTFTNLSFLFFYNHLLNSHAENAIYFAEVLIVIAVIVVLFIKTNKSLFDETEELIGELPNLQS